MSFRSAARLAAGVGLAAMLAALGGCGQMGNPFEAITGQIPPPDEFQVMRYEPPVVPSSRTLPEPQPGAPSPRAPRPNEAAVAAVLGPVAAQAAAAEPSPGEQALLSSADASSASSEIRVQLEQDKRQAVATAKYEPPTIWELLGFGGDRKKIDESQLIEPVSESERLQAAGVPVPVDPEAAARAAKQKAEPEEEAVVIDRRPTNRVGPAPKPAY